MSHMTVDVYLISKNKWIFNKTMIFLLYINGDWPVVNLEPRVTVLACQSHGYIHCRPTKSYIIKTYILFQEEVHHAIGHCDFSDSWPCHCARPGSVVYSPWSNGRPTSTGPFVYTARSDGWTSATHPASKRPSTNTLKTRAWPSTISAIPTCWFSDRSSTSWRTSSG